MLGLVVCLLRQAARQVRVVAVLIQFALGVRQQLLGLAKRDRRIAAHPCAVGVGQQTPRLAQVLRLDGNQLRIAVKTRGFDVATFRPLEVAALEQTDGVAELALRFLPDFRGQLRGARIRGVLAAFHHLRQRRLCDPGFLGRCPEVGCGIRGVGTYVLDVAAALEAGLGVAVFLHSPLVASRREQLGIDRVGGFLGRVRIPEKGIAQLVLRVSRAGGQQQQADGGELRETGVRKHL